MIPNQTPYDAALNSRNQLQHGLWVLRLHLVKILKGDGDHQTGAKKYSGRAARAVEGVSR